MARVAVYTAIFGGYDRLWHAPAHPDVDFVCFTDDPSLEAPPWRVVEGEARFEHPRMSAKWFKALPQLALPDHRYTIWLDGSVKIRSDAFAEQVMQPLGESGIAMLRHPDRDNIFDEAEHSLRMSRYSGQPIREQVEHYKDEGFTSDNDLFWCGLIVRDNQNERVRELNEAWMRENERWSYQDQLSMPYLLWKLGITPAVIPLALRENDLFRRIGHRTPD